MGPWLGGGLDEIVKVPGVLICAVPATGRQEGTHVSVTTGAGVVKPRSVPALRTETNPPAVTASICSLVSLIGFFASSAATASDVIAVKAHAKSSIRTISILLCARFRSATT